jgi:hypothetical protein
MAPPQRCCRGDWSAIDDLAEELTGDPQSLLAEGGRFIEP